LQSVPVADNPRYAADGLYFEPCDLDLGPFGFKIAPVSNSMTLRFSCAKDIHVDT